ncbi:MULTISPECIES: hypothetical protein [Amycolatopsis]|uniref:Tetratricopeptide repeat protein n=1 Tax=Amycolatopsis thermalba TaxID=944492 RepID=A0ABY4NZ47_9PSEU|nr:MULTISPECIES: hypothetical protein [Amycolatopsis]OXM75050.1 hypothetical protein CF166_00115 [Amycolatopsis sp. KNN50.9b]UQS25350.1 hypothetical protein L1857_22340 [Amycolatopsis thermalba]
MDKKALLDSLRQATTTGSRELDRICEAAAAELMAAGAEPPFEVGSADFAADPFLICADRYWRLRFLELPTVETAARCAHWLTRSADVEQRTEIAQKWALGYAFITRDTVESARELTEASGWILEEHHGSSAIAYFATVYHAGKLRANFAFDDLRLFLDSALLALACDEHRNDPLFVALEAFAAFGSRTITAEHAITLLDKAWASPQRTLHVVDLCLNALAAAAPFEGQADLLRTRAEEAVAAFPDNHIFYFRLAAGQRMSRDCDTALDTIDTALRLLPATGNRGSHKLLQEQYLRERDMIQEGRQLAQWSAEERQRWAAQEASNADLRRTLQNSTVRAIELVTVFTAAIAFAVGSLQVTLAGTLAVKDRIWMIITFGAGLLAFALLIIGGTWWITRRRRNP